MLDALKRSWEQFKEETPGKRFQKRYERRHQSGQGGISRFLYIGGGIALLAAGLFFLPAPGPGTVILLIGAGMIAQEWRMAARAMDWLELRVRAGLDWLRQTWEQASLPVRILLVLVALAIAGGVAYAAYQLLFAGR